MKFVVINGKKIVKAVCLITAIVVIFLSVRASGAYAVFYGKTSKKLPIYRVQTEEKKIAISFDCAWGVDYTDKLLEIMEKENVKCTFFAVEFWVKKHPEYLKKISDAGHEVGTHSSTHPHMSKLDKAAIVNELTSSCAAIENVIGIKPKVFRPPYGEYNDLLIDTANELGLVCVQWDVDSLDWKDLSAKEIKERVLKRVKSGSIVLFHNQGLHTSEALLDIIVALKKDGYSFVSVGDLVYKENYTVLPDGTQVLNG